MSTDNYIDPQSRSLAQLFLSNQFNIPDYQQSYSWDSELVKSLLVDIAYAADQEKPCYFLGAIILSGSIEGLKEEVLEVVDGQQRIVTIALLIAAIRSMIKEFGLKEIDSWQEKYWKLGEYIFRKRNGLSEEDLPRLRLGPDSHEIYETILLDKEIVQHGQADVSKILDKRYREVQAFLRQRYFIGNIHSNEAKQQDFSGFINYLLEKVILVVMITDEKKLDAYEIFEVLNDRRQTLTQIDLLKAYFFRIADKSSTKEFNIVKKGWGDLMDTFISNTDGDTIKDKESNEKELKHCIESYFMFKFGYLQPKNLYRQVKDRIIKKGKSNKEASSIVRGYIQDLSDRPVGVANYYRQIKSNNIDLKRKDDNQLVKQYIDFLNDFLVLYPSLLVPLVNKEWSDKDIVRYYRLLYYTILRIYATKTSFPVNKLQPFWANLAHRLHRSEFSNFNSLKKKLIDELSRDYPLLTDQESFINGFYDLTIGSMGKARQILLAINYLYPQAEERQTNVADIYCECILPQSTGAGEWNSFTEEDKKLYSKRLGNYTLLDRKASKVLRDSSYEDKKQIYKQSRMKITRVIPEQYENWDVGAIKGRQKYMAELAEEGWQLDKV